MYILIIFFRYKASKTLTAEAELLHLKIVQAYRVKFTHFLKYFHKLLMHLVYYFFIF